MSKQDEELIEAARAAIKPRYRNDWQEVGAAMRTRDGRVLTGVNLDAYLDPVGIWTIGWGHALVLPNGDFLRGAANRSTARAASPALSR